MPDDDEGDTSIRIKIDTWRELKDLKDQPNQSFDDVIQELLDDHHDRDEEQAHADDEGNPEPVTAHN